MARLVKFVITMGTARRSDQSLPIPAQRSALDGPAGEVQCGCPCYVHEAHGLTEVCQHSAEQLMRFTIRLSGDFRWVGTARWPTCAPCAQAIRAAFEQKYERRRRQLAGEHRDDGEHHG
jgi:hypothetical protein